MSILIKKAARLLPKLASNFEIIIVNDGSKDHSAAVLAGLKKHMPFLKIVTHPVNKGYGAALKSGFRNARKDFIFYTDGDGQYDMDELKNLVAEMKDGVDVVNGYKINRADNLLRKICGDVYSRFTKIVFGLKIRDVDCDFRLIRKKVIKSISLEKDS
ncbi:MAG: glycosyltransferase family 2 protein [bacterium]|nr:glycosyltransferase family 2 protein [bacterium]